ncbi:MAG: L-threonylcarbamoyladenylate synthase [Actinomycetota bacterium]|nr:L-threonylcarbamoyladenylate synthase [Actinomycetota bacterium]
MAGITVVEAAAAIRDGGVAIIPTDTVYGIGARPEAAGAIFRIKNRPRDKALPVLAAEVGQLGGTAELDGLATSLAAWAWPGPLTIVVRRAPEFRADLGGNDDGTVGVRVPAHDVALELLRQTGPLAVTSANVSGQPPATTYDAACALAPGAVCLDGGTCDGAPSTVIKLVGQPEVLREGALSSNEVLARIRRLRTGS